MLLSSVYTNKRVNIGMSAAFALSQHPDLFSVTLYERSSDFGGMATSTPIDENKYGASYINDGVQGASPVFYNTYAMFDRLGFKPSEVGMQVSFGRDPQEEFWSNVFPSQVIDKYVHFREEIHHELMLRQVWTGYKEIRHSAEDNQDIRAHLCPRFC